MPAYKKKEEQTLTLGSVVLVQGVLSPAAIKQMKLKKTDQVVVCEGRPSLESAKANAKLLIKSGVVPTVISDNMPGFLFFKGYVKEVVLACQYADKDGALCDTGALICAVLASKHNVPLRLVQGQLKTRFLGDPKDLLCFEGQSVAPKGTHGYVPLVEWVPVKYLKRAYAK